ncbi:MAG: 50S ribosomal protein L18e [Thermoplasmata archaeon]
MARRVGKQNPELLRLVIELRRAARSHDAPLWASVADRLERARHSIEPINVSGLERLAAAGETVAVPGKVLADGKISKPLTVGAFAFSAEARAKIRAAGGTAVSLMALLKAKPEGAGVRLLA